MAPAAALSVPARSRWRAATGGASKLALGIGIFAAILSGWTLFQIEQDTRAPLPGLTGQEGPCTLWFIGSSSIHKWGSLEGDMRPWQARNRGIGGASVGDIVERFSRERAAVHPAAIVMYAGENDLAEGVSVEGAVAGLDRLLALKRAAYGMLPVVLVSLKPSPTRWAQRGLQSRYNMAMREIAARRADISYVDIVPDMLVGAAPGPFYVADGVHMNAAGYRGWAMRIRPALEAALPRATVRRCTGTA